MKRAQLNLILLVAVVGLGAAVYFSQKKEEKGPPLTALTPAALTKISIEYPKSPAISLEKQNGSWKLTAPVQADTEQLEIAALLNLSDTVTEATLEAAQVKLEDLGLAPPQYKITLNDQLLEFGNVEPLKYRRYVKSGEKIFLIGDPSSASLDADYADLVSRSVLPQGSDVKKIVVPGLTVQHAADGKSWTVEPAQADIKQETLQQFVDGWKDLKSMWNAADIAEGSKGDAVSITLGDGSEIKLIIAEREPQLILARPDLKLRYTPSKALAETLFKLPAPEKKAP